MKSQREEPMSCGQELTLLRNRFQPRRNDDEPKTRAKSSICRRPNASGGGLRLQPVRGRIPILVTCLFPPGPGPVPQEVPADTRKFWKPSNGRVNSKREVPK